MAQLAIRRARCASLQQGARFASCWRTDGNNFLVQVYGRMRLCRTMVRDHFTPSYLRNMRHAIAAFEDDYSDFGGVAP